jgi:hypothetical protein
VPPDPFAVAVQRASQELIAVLAEAAARNSALPGDCQQLRARVEEPSKARGGRLEAQDDLARRFGPGCAVLARQGFVALALLEVGRCAGNFAWRDALEALLPRAPARWVLGDACGQRVRDTLRARLSAIPGRPDPYTPGLLIQSLIPASQRRSAGEYYTPRWMVERATELAGWAPSDGAIPGLLDPTCGAGAFLLPAIERAAAHLADRRTPSASIVKEISDCIRGYDRNPLAVLAARVAWVLSLAEHLTDGPLPIIPIGVRDVLAAPFAPKHHGGARFVVGNPPWIRWSDVPEPEREAVARAAKAYGLVPGRAWHGGSEVDVSAVVAYATSDVDLLPEGRACLVLPRAHLHAPASERFRRLVLPDGSPLGLQAVEDFERVRAFRGAAVHPVLLCWAKGQEASRSPRARVWTQRAPVAEDASWEQASSALAGEDRVALRSPSDGRICLCGSEDTALFAKLSGGTDWLRGRKGVTTDLNGAYFVRVLGACSSGERFRVINDCGGRGHAVPVHEFEVERELLHPLLKGAASIGAFAVTRGEALAVVVPNSGIRKQLSEQAFEQQFPCACKHFRWVEQQTGGALSARATFRRMGGRSAVFFALYNVGDYTFRPYKVVWPEISSRFRAAVATCAPLVPGAPAIPLVPDHKVYFAALDDAAAADFVCALLNAPPVRRFVESFTARLQIGTLLQTLRIPKYDSQRAAHQQLAELGRTLRLQGADADSQLQEAALCVLGDGGG